MKLFGASSISAFGSRPALHLPDGNEWSFLELARFAASLRAALGARGLVFHLCGYSPESVGAYLALLDAGLPQLLLPETIAAGDFARLRELYEPRYIFLPRARSDLPLAGAGEVFSAGAQSLRAREPATSYELHAELALLLRTSGSTGGAKTVRLSRRNLFANADAIARVLGIGPADRAITTLPMHNAYGLSILNSHLLRGGSLSLCRESLVRPGFWEMLRTSRATNFGGVPFHFESLKKLHFERMQFPDLRYLTQAGGRLSPALVGEFTELCRQKGMKFFVMYGQTEATARISCVPWDRAGEKTGSVGLPLPGSRLAVVGDDGVPMLESGRSGELELSGESVSLGYADDARDLALGDVNRGVLRTGDIGYHDAEGYFYLTGRKSRFVKIGGARVSLDEVEELGRRAGVECACTGSDEQIVLHVPGRNVPENLAGLLARQAGLPPAAVVVKAVPELPRNEAGKVLYARL